MRDINQRGVYSENTNNDTEIKTLTHSISHSQLEALCSQVDLGAACKLGASILQRHRPARKHDGLEAPGSQRHNFCLEVWSPRVHLGRALGRRTRRRGPRGRQRRELGVDARLEAVQGRRRRATFERVGDEERVGKLGPVLLQAAAAARAWALAAAPAATAGALRRLHRVQCLVEDGRFGVRAHDPQQAHVLDVRVGQPEGARRGVVWSGVAGE